MRLLVIMFALAGLIVPLGVVLGAGHGDSPINDYVSAQDVDIGREVTGQTVQTRLEFAQKCGLNAEQLRLVMRAKGQLARLSRQLMQQAEALAITLGSDTLSDDEKRAAIDGYVVLRDESIAKYKAMEGRVVKAVGADEDPLAMGALMILGAADTGKRPACAVRSSVSGGAGTDVRGDPAHRGSLRQSSRTPPLWRRQMARRWNRALRPGPPTFPR